MQQESKPLNPNHIYADWHEPCGTNIRNAKTRACIACDRLKKRKQYEAKHPNAKKYAPTIVPATEAPKQLVDIVVAKKKVEIGGVLPQAPSIHQKHALSERLKADLAQFLESGGEIVRPVREFQVKENISHDVNRYTNHNCRCDVCKKSMADYHAAAMNKAVEVLTDRVIELLDQGQTEAPAIAKLLDTSAKKVNSTLSRLRKRGKVHGEFIDGSKIQTWMLLKKKDKAA